MKNENIFHLSSILMELKSHSFSRITQSPQAAFKPQITWCITRKSLMLLHEAMPSVFYYGFSFSLPLVCFFSNVK